MAELPIDVIETHILSRLSIEFTYNFKFVSKYFNSLISSPEFIDNQLRRSVLNNTDRFVILNATNHGFHVFDLDALESPPFFLPFPVTFNQNIYMIGSCNGLVCLGNAVSELMLLNPLTGMSFKIPVERTFHKHSFGFGFDGTSKDYKVVQISTYYGRREVMVYSMRANSWKVIESLSTPIDQPQPGMIVYGNGVLIDNHLLHWIFAYRDHDNPKTSIECFDLGTEQWVQNVALPHENIKIFVDYYNYCVTLGVFDGRLCLLTPVWSVSRRLTHFEMWIMKEYGVKDSWVKLLGELDLCVTESLRMCPIGLSHGSIINPDPQDELLLVRGKKHTYPGAHRVVAIWYNMNDKKSRLSEVHKVHGIPEQIFDVCTCTKSLVPLPGGSFIRKEPSPQNLPYLRYLNVPLSEI